MFSKTHSATKNFHWLFWFTWIHNTHANTIPAILVFVATIAFFDSHLTTVDTLVQRVEWISQNGNNDNAEPLDSIAYEVFPKTSYRSSPEVFSMQVRARLSCDACGNYILGKNRDEFLSNVSNFEATMESFNKDKNILINRLQETDKAVSALSGEVEKLRKKFINH